MNDPTHALPQPRHAPPQAPGPDPAAPADPHGHAHASAHAQVHVRPYVIVFLALLAGTGLTVWAAQIHFGSHVLNIGVALAIAAVKASLVAGYFMHLISERKLIYGVLVATGFFFVGLMALTIWADHDFPRVPGG